MKRLYIIKYIFIFTMISQLLSCDAFFDSELPKRDLAAENAIVDQKSAESALLGVYSYLGVDNGIFDSAFACDNGVRSGILVRPAGSYASELTNFDVKPITLENKDKWIAIYQMINAANNVIHFVDKLDESLFLDGRKQGIIAEARFMRAFAGMMLMKYYTQFWDITSQYGLLIRNQPAALEVNNKKRSSVADSYKFIEEDLRYAVQYAPAYNSCFTASKGAAKAFLANMLMIRGGQGDYAEAAGLANEVIKSEGFAKEEKFENIFTNDYKSKEIIFARFLSATSATNADNKSASVKKVMGGSVVPSKKFHDTFKNDDARFENTFDSVMYTANSSTKKQQVWKKMWRTSGNCPFYYMRVGQMYLIRAEALARTDAPQEDVLAELNVLRLRSGNSEYTLPTGGYEKSVLMDMIFNEYLYELAGENDTEWLISIRFHTSGGSRKISMYSSTYVDDAQLTFPIPEVEMLNNTKMEDNPVY